MDSGRGGKRHPGIFDLDPELYDVLRSGYPAAMFESMVEPASLHPGGRLLDTGCGTRKVTSWLAERGYSVSAVEKGPSPSNFARRRFAAVGNVSVLNTAFETYCDSSEYDLVYGAVHFTGLTGMRHSQSAPPKYADADIHHCSGATSLSQISPGGMRSLWRRFKRRYRLNGMIGPLDTTQAL